MSTPARFIPPEFFGPVGLGQTITAIGEQREERRQQRRQEELQERQLQVIEDNAFFTRATAMEPLVGKQGALDFLVANRRLPEGTEAFLDPEDVKTQDFLAARDTPIDQRTPEQHVLMSSFYGLNPGETPEQAAERVRLDVEAVGLNVEAARENADVARQFRTAAEARGVTPGELRFMEAQTGINLTEQQIEESRARASALRAQARGRDPMAEARSDIFRQGTLKLIEKGIEPDVAVTFMTNPDRLTAEQRRTVSAAFARDIQQAEAKSAAEQIGLLVDMVEAGIEVPDASMATVQAAGLNAMTPGQDAWRVESVEKPRLLGLLGTSTVYKVSPISDQAFSEQISSLGVPQSAQAEVRGMVTEALKSPEETQLLIAQLEQLPDNDPLKSLTLAEIRAQTEGESLLQAAEATAATDTETAPPTPPAAPAPPEPQRELSEAEKLERQLAEREAFFRENPPKTERLRQLRDEGTERLKERIARARRVEEVLQGVSVPSGAITRREIAGGR